MYKILIIFLFAFLIADESIMYFTTQGWERSDRLKLVESDIEKMINPFIDEMNNLLNPNMFLIKIRFKIIDTKKIENISLDSLMSTFKRIENSYFEKGGFTDNHVFIFYKLTDSGDYCEFRTTEFIIEVNVDHSIVLDNQIQDMVWGTAEIKLGVDREQFPDILRFNSVDISKIKNNHKTKIINRDDIYDNSWAVIIGIDKYQYSDPLQYAVKDAEAVRNMLIDKFDYPEENIRYLIDEEATLSNIKLNLGEVATSAGENDRVLVFYSGHGQTLIGTDNSEKGYIIPYEGKQDNPYATGIAMDEILTTSQISKSKHMLFLMDACYSGLMTEHVKGLKPQEEGYLTKVANEQARQIITAGGNEPAIEGGRWNHSVFTKNLLSGLDDWDADTDSDGYITADELGTYLRKSVTEDSNNQQTPQKGRFMNSGTGEFVFFSDVTVTLPSNNLYEEDEIISGCMDENANNYNPNATKPDRSCQYGQLVTSIEFGEIKKMNKVMGNDMKSRLEAIIPGGKTGEKFVEGYFEVPVIINNNSNIAGVQFEIEGGVILEASGGIVEENGFMTSHTESMVLSFSLKEGGVFPKGGNQVLIKLQIEPKDRDICIRNIVLASIDGDQMQSTSFDCFKP